MSEPVGVEPRTMFIMLLVAPTGFAMKRCADSRLGTIILNGTSSGASGLSGLLGCDGVTRKFDGPCLPAENVDCCTPTASDPLAPSANTLLVLAACQLGDRGIGDPLRPGVPLPDATGPLDGATGAAGFALRSFSLLEKFRSLPTGISGALKAPSSVTLRASGCGGPWPSGSLMMPDTSASGVLASAVCLPCVDIKEAGPGCTRRGARPRQVAGHVNGR
mmetsp:Transcript_14745/g.43256  ORF Transcript_14745/g.43256 Transcript_14745/m.43256 type:complete len:219 (+) Transcript_14745:3201-3857(+)